VSAFSRYVFLSTLLPTLKAGAKIAVWGMPGNNQKTDILAHLDDLNAEKGYEPDFGFVHLNTVMVNEALVLLVAAQKGGGDPAFNPSLRFAVDAARAANMPRDTIEKAIKKGSGEGSEERYEPARYEGYAPGGVALIVECLITNANKVAADIRMIFDKNGGKIGVPGSVSFGFSQKGQVIVEGATEEKLMDCALEAGCVLNAKVVGALKMAELKAFVAKRPVYSAMATQKLAALTGIEPRDWRESVREHVFDMAGRGAFRAACD
jgi:hypothetical protein